MLKVLLYLSIFFTAVIPFSSHAQDKCSELFSGRRAVIAREVLDEKLYAVHITDFMPENGLLRTATKDRVRFATTLHFSLGGPVISHFDGNWNNKKYAVLLPLKALGPQLLNIFSQDTFIVGDLKLPAEAVLLVPFGENITTEFPGKIVRYDTKLGIIESVKRQLRTQKTITLESTGPSLTDKTYLNGKEVDEKLLFKDYLDARGKVTHQMHFSTNFGVLDVGMYQFMRDWYYRERPAVEALSNLRYRRLVLYEHLKLVSEQVVKMHLPETAMLSFTEGVNEFQGFMNILDAEIWVQQKFQKSLLAAGQSIRKDVLARRGNLEGLKFYLAENLVALPEIGPTGPGRDLFVGLALKDFKGLGFARFKLLVEQHALENTGIEPFDIESLILAKAVESYLEDPTLLETAIRQFEKTIAMSPDWGFARLRGYIGKISNPDDQEKFFRKESVRELYQGKLKRPESL